MKLPSVTLPKIANIPDISRFTGLAAPIVAIVVSVVITILVTWPKFSEVLKLRTSNQELEVRIASLGEKVAVLERLDASRSELELQLASGEQLLPSDKNVFSVIQSVEGVSSSSGVLLNRLEVTPGAIGSSSGGDATSAPAPAQAAPAAGGGATVADAAPKVSLKIAVTSDYLSFLQFINSMLSFSRVVSVSDLSLASSGSTDQAYQIRSSLTVNAFWQPLPTELASVESPVEVLTKDEEDLLKSVQFTGTTQTTTPTGEIPTIPTGKTDIFAPTF